MDYDERIKISFTVSRLVASEIESAIEKYIGDDYEDDYDAEKIDKSLRIVLGIINRAYTRNKSVKG